ncbi:MAG: orotate phosphoribosyltransferase [Peptococcaceae bacterium]|nr:orotate phosphoribosyltransferase [Peptococcaceae bacterium]
MILQDSKKDFIEFMLASNVLRFGSFMTKSGRETPYFINTGFYNDGQGIEKLGHFYANCIEEYVPADIQTIYGPSYKGIPLAVATTVAMQNLYGKNLHYSFNRKEVKDHGEGGLIVGYTPQDGDNIVIVEDVITAGLSITESMGILKSIADIHVQAIIVSVDRMERGELERTAIQEIQHKFGAPVYPIVTIEEVVNYIYNEKKGGRMIIDEAMKEKIEVRIVR